MSFVHPVHNEESQETSSQETINCVTLVNKSLKWLPHSSAESQTGREEYVYMVGQKFPKSFKLLITIN